MGDVDFGVPAPSRLVRRLVALLVSVLALFVLGVALTALPSRAERLSDFQPRFSHHGLKTSGGCGVGGWFRHASSRYYEANEPSAVTHQRCRADLGQQGWRLVSYGGKRWRYEKRGYGVAGVVSTVGFWEYRGKSRIAVTITAPIFHSVWRGR